MLSNVSPTIHSAFRGDWKENHSSVYTFEDVTEKTLICFITWAYLGDYSSKTVGISSNVEEYVDEPMPTEPEEYGWGVSKSRKKDKKGKRHSEWDRIYIVEDVPVPEPEPDLAPLCDTEIDPQTGETKKPDDTNDPQGNIAGESRTDTTEPLHPLLLHIQLYVFANIYIVDSLKTLSEQKIVIYLEKAELSEKGCTSEIFDLLDFAFSNLPEDDDLLYWLANYSSWKLGALRVDMRRLDNLLRMVDGNFSRLLARHVLPSKKSPFKITIS